MIAIKISIYGICSGWPRLLYISGWTVEANCQLKVPSGGQLTPLGGLLKFTECSQETRIAGFFIVTGALKEIRRVSKHTFQGSLGGRTSLSHPGRQKAMKTQNKKHRNTNRQTEITLHPRDHTNSVLHSRTETTASCSDQWDAVDAASRLPSPPMQMPQGSNTQTKGDSPYRRPREGKKQKAPNRIESRM